MILGTTGPAEPSSSNITTEAYRSFYPYAFLQKYSYNPPIAPVKAETKKQSVLVTILDDEIFSDRLFFDTGSIGRAISPVNYPLSNTSKL